MTLEDVPGRESQGAHSSSSTNSSQLNVANSDSVSESSWTAPAPALSPKPKQRFQLRAPDMQLGRCPWVRVYDNVTYIVVGMIFREVEGRTEMLLIQEAKRKCRGKWYMPAGHVEPGETIEQAVQREVREETGFEAQPLHLLSVEVKGSGWYRMAYFCEITGGQLKTEPDLESLQANWFDVADIKAGRVDLRGTDFFKVLNEALHYRDWRRTADLALHEPIVNVNEVQPGLFIEFVIVRESSVSDRTEVLVHKFIHNEDDLLGKHDGFPMVEFGFEYFFPVVVSKCYRHLVEDGHNVIGVPSRVLGTWCWPESIDSVHHGLRLRLLCLHKKSAKTAAIFDERRYHWLPIESADVKRRLGLDPAQFHVPLFML